MPMCPKRDRPHRVMDAKHQAFRKTCAGRSPSSSRAERYSEGDQLFAQLRVPQCRTREVFRNGTLVNHWSIAVAGYYGSVKLTVSGTMTGTAMSFTFAGANRQRSTASIAD